MKIIEVSSTFNRYLLKSFDKQALDIANSINGCYIAGGAPLAMYTNKLQNISDWDIFCKDYGALESVVMKLDEYGFEEAENNPGHLINLYKCCNSGQDTKVQVMTIFHESLEKLYDHFDLSICCIAYKNGNFYIREESIEDIKRKEINFIHTGYPEVCIKRVKKYEAKGYQVSNSFWEDFNNRDKNKDDIKVSGD